MCPTYQYFCGTCGTDSDAHYRISERPEEIECPECGAPARYHMGSPQPLRASYRDGVRRFTDQKEAVKLHREAAVSKSSERRKEIAKEIRKMGVRVTRGEPI